MEAASEVPRFLQPEALPFSPLSSTAKSSVTTYNKSSATKQQIDCNIMKSVVK